MRPLHLVRGALSCSFQSITHFDSLSAGLGELGYITFEAGSDYQLELALWDLTTNVSTNLYDFPPRDLEVGRSTNSLVHTAGMRILRVQDGYVASSTIFNDTWVLSLQVRPCLMRLAHIRTASAQTKCNLTFLLSAVRLCARRRLPGGV
jgi:hypothetical protein